jgi:hypothetical protein
VVTGAAADQPPPSFAAGRYGRATILELKGHTQISAVPAVTIDWGRVIGKIA